MLNLTATKPTLKVVFDQTGTPTYAYDLAAAIHDIVENSTDKDDIRMSDEVYNEMLELRKFMFARVYTNPVAKGEEGKAVDLVKTLYDYYLHHEDRFPGYLKNLLDKGEPIEKVTCDYVSSMTDRFAIARYGELFIPKSWSVY